MDVQNFIDYQSAQIYFDNTDWPGNNIKYWRPQTSEGKWRWIVYDTSPVVINEISRHFRPSRLVRSSPSRSAKSKPVREWLQAVSPENAVM